MTNRSRSTSIAGMRFPGGASPHISVVAVGDISFQGPAADTPFDCFARVRGELTRGDVVIGNLESPLTDEGRPVAGKCTLRGSPAWAPYLRRAGFTLVSLANNHTMDYGSEGLESTLKALGDAGILAVGAGRDVETACAPVVQSVNGATLACLARTAVPVSAPNRAGRRIPGVAFFDLEDTLAAVRRCRRQADVVIVLLHWGLEEYRYPSPTQRRWGRALVSAGAQLVLGHHPHVLQGLERLSSGLIAYSLGNFIFSEFNWAYTGRDGERVSELSRLSAENRESMVFSARCSSSSTPDVRLTPACVVDSGAAIDGHAGRDAELDALGRPFIRRGYRLWWRGYSLRKEWQLRVRKLVPLSLTCRDLLRVRPRHLRHLLQLLRRSARVISERSVNPYE